MRSPVYRNLDSPFRIAGFSPLELTVLCFTVAGGGEISADFGFNRGWAFALTIFLAFMLYGFRRAFGDLFAARLFRFLYLPSELKPQLFNWTRSRC